MNKSYFWLKSLVVKWREGRLRPLSNLGIHQSKREEKVLSQCLFEFCNGSLIWSTA